MTAALEPFIDVTGFPAEGVPVQPTPRAAQHLIAAGWTAPEPRSRVEELLAEVFHPEAHEYWLNHPVKRFSGRTPQELIENGEGTEVEKYLDALADGVVL